MRVVLTSAGAAPNGYDTCFASFSVAVSSACAVTLTPAAAASSWTYATLWKPATVTVQDDLPEVSGLPV
jgi:hypothetical protein